MAYLAPTYDHASCLGRNESDEKRKRRLITKDTSFSVQAYVTNCKSALYAKDSDKKPLKTFDAFREALQRYPIYTWTAASSALVETLAYINALRVLLA
ncbi:hypothetical protein [Scytonema sp. NUACC26]|uniref:hypothetical protein n=1 Tax=Scytonema sp. NUACC26 TaxID=3140176 RepID=UPI0034DBEEFC